jgi:GNAT superfamily N-acetyltransferase
VATTAVEAIGSDGRERADATLRLAFGTDPVMRWFWPDSDVYSASFPRFIDAIAGSAYAASTAWWADRGAAVALWLGPGAAPDDEALTQVMVESVDPSLLEDLIAFGDLVGAHHPAEPHWYLPVTGVDPFVQGRGLGSTLLAHALRSCDREHLPAYLEASTLRSRRLYERHGFEAVGEIQVGSSPTVFSMLRAAT